MGLHEITGIMVESITESCVFNDKVRSRPNLRQRKRRDRRCLASLKKDQRTRQGRDEFRQRRLDLQPKGGHRNKKMEPSKRGRTGTPNQKRRLDWLTKKSVRAPITRIRQTRRRRPGKITDKKIDKGRS